MHVKKIYTGLLLCVFLVGLFAVGLGGRSESLSFWPAAFTLAAAVLLGALGFARGYHGRASLPAVGCMIGFLVYVILRGLATYHDAEGVAFIARQDMLFAAGGLFCYVMVTAHFEKVRHRIGILLVFGILLLVNLWAARVQTTGQPSWQPQADLAKAFPALGDSFGWHGWQRYPDKSEAGGLFQSENHFGGFVAMLGSVFMGLTIFAKGPLRLLALLAVLGCGWGAAASESRGGTIAFLLGIVCTTLVWGVTRLQARGRKLDWKLISMMLAVTAALAAGGFSLSNRLSERYAKSGGVFAASQMKFRMVMSQFAWNQFQQAPIFGTGARSYEHMEREQRNIDIESHWAWDGGSDVDAVFAHNDWAQLMGDYGFIGGGLAFAVLVTHLVAGLQMISRSGRNKEEDPTAYLGNSYRAGLAAGGVGAMLAVAAVSFVDFNLHISTNVCVLAVILGFLANPGRVQYEEKVDKEGMPVVPRHGLLLRPGTLCLGVAVAGGVCLAGPDLFKADKLFAASQLLVEADSPDYFETNQKLTECLELDKENFHAAMAAGDLNVEEARKIFVLVRDRELTPAHREFQERVRRSHLRRAEDWYAKAYLIYPKRPYAALGAGNALSMASDFDKAEAWFMKAMAHGKGSRQLAIDLGTHYLRWALAVGDLPTKLSLVQRAITQLERGKRVFRVGDINGSTEVDKERAILYKKIAEANKWAKDLEARIHQTVPQGEKPSDPAANPAESTPQVEKPAPLVPAEATPVPRTSPEPLVPATPPQP